MEQQGYFQIFRERWLAMLAALLLGLGAAAAIGALIPPSYTATATLLLSVDSREGNLSDRSQFSLQRIGSYPELAYSPDVLGQTIEELDLDLSFDQLADRITATNPTTTLLLRIGANSDTAQGAADLANSVASNLAQVVSGIENSSRNVGVSVTLDLTNPAVAPTRPTSPQMPIILALGLLAGLAAGLIAAIVWARVDTTVRSVSQVRRVSGLPVLGQWSTTEHRRFARREPEHPQPASESAPPREHRRAAARQERLVNQLRETQLAIRQANAAAMPKLLLLVPASDSAANASELADLARTIAATGRRVCLVENQAPFGLTQPLPQGRKGKGLGGVLAGGQALKAAIVPIEGESFSLLPAGDAGSVPDETVAEQHIAAVAGQLGSMFDTTVVEATSATQPASLELVAPHADAVVVLARYGSTSAADLSHTIAKLRLLGVQPLGVVMTAVPPRHTSDLVASWLPADFATSPRRPVAESVQADSGADAATPGRGVLAVVPPKDRDATPATKSRSSSTVK